MVGSDSTVMPSTAEASAAVPNLEVSEVRIASQGFESFGSVVAALQVEGGFGPAFQNLFASVVPTIRLNSRVANVTGAAASSGQKPTVFLESGEAVEFDAVVVTLPLDTFPMPLEADIGRPLGTFADNTSYDELLRRRRRGRATAECVHHVPRRHTRHGHVDGTGASSERQFFFVAGYEPADTAYGHVNHARVAGGERHVSAGSFCGGHSLKCSRP